MHFTEYDTRLAAYAAIVNDADEILLTWFNGEGVATPSWTMPGGGVDYDESITDAVVREVYEETGYHVEAAVARRAPFCRATLWPEFTTVPFSALPLLRHHRRGNIGNHGGGWIHRPGSLDPARRCTEPERRAGGYRRSGGVGGRRAEGRLIQPEM